MLHAPMKCEVITKVCNYNIKCADGNTTLSHLLMCECWREDPDGRPTFSDLVSTISESLEGLAGYMDFSPTWSSGDKTIHCTITFVHNVNPQCINLGSSL